jgi:P-type E1-E2 ATPase
MLILETKNLGRLELRNLVLDLNGTITQDGILLPGIPERIARLKSVLEIYLLSADTFGTAKKIAEELDIKLIKLQFNGSESDEKANILSSLDPEHTIAIGNGQNDIKMLKLAKIGIGILGTEGMAAGIVQSAKIIVTSPNDALDLLLHQKRLIATIRD